MSDSVTLPLTWTPQAALRPPTLGERLDASLHLLDRSAAETIADEWQDLALRAVEDNPFLDPDILLPAMRHLDPHGRVRIATARGPTGQLALLMPVHHRRLGHVAPALTLWTHVYGPLGTPLIDAEAGETTARMLLTETSGRALVFPFLPLDGPAARLLAAEAEGRPIDRSGVHRRAMIDRMSESSADLRAALSQKKRSDMARQMRRLAELGRIDIETDVEAAPVRRRFEEFMALEAAGWKGRRGTALASDPHSAAFARDVIFRRSGAGGCRITSLRVAGRPVAMVVSFVSRATAVTWKIAYDEDLARYSPGAQLMLEAGAALLDEPAVQRIDSLATADNPMIDQLWHDRLAVGTVVFGPRRSGPLYRLGLAGERLEHAARNLVRSLRAEAARRRETE